MDKKLFKINVGKRLAELRTSHGYSQKYLAQQLNVAVTTYKSWELGKTLTNINNFYKLAIKIYNMSLQEFFAPCR